MALTLFVTKWLWKRLEDDGDDARQMALKNLYTMTTGVAALALWALRPSGLWFQA